MRKKSTILFGIVILVLLGCTKIEGLTGKVINEKPNDKIIFGVDTFTMASSPVFVAEAKEFWREEGLDVEIKPFVNSRLALDALLGEAVEVATVVDFAAVLAAFQEQNVKIITTISTSEKHVNLLARKDKGILKPQDLSGKKLPCPLAHPENMY